MALFGPAAPWLLVLGSLAWFLAAAKTHGRQVRLERELDGHWEVDFRHDNNPAVEALWWRDRVRFWWTAVVLAPLLVGFHVLVATIWWPAIDDVGGVVGHNLVVALLWAPSIAFLSNAWSSWSRVRRRLREHGAAAGIPDFPAWVREARMGSLAWFSVAFGLAVLVIVLAWP